MASWLRAGPLYPRELPEDAIVRLPTLLVWGRDDAFLDFATAAPTLELCADAALVEIPNAGHWLLHEEPAHTSQLLIDFFQAVGLQIARHHGLPPL